MRARSRVWPVAGAALAAAVVVIAVRTFETANASRPASIPALPASPRPAFRIPAPKLLSERGPTARWSTIVRTVRVRGSPSARAAGTVRLRSRTTDGTANVVLVLGTAEDVGGHLWVRVRLPGLTGETTGWVPRSALSAYHAVRTRLVVDVERERLTLLRDGRPIFRALVGVGKPETPTPHGEFYVLARLTRYASAFYGPLAFGTSARSRSFTDWPGGGFIGIHGTNRPDLVPGRVSHGCIRLRNGDIERLGRLLPVGTPISIV